MNKEEMQTKAEEVIKKGHADELSEDEIKVEMFGAGIPFSKLNGLYKSTAISLGLMVDPKEVTNGINEVLPNVDFDGIDTWEGVEELIENIVNNVEGATEGRALTLVRAYAKEEEIELPKKPKSSGKRGPGGGGKIARAVAKLFASNPQPTKQEFYDVVYQEVSGKKHNNATYYVNSMMPLAFAVKQGISLEDAIAALKDQPDAVNSNPEDEEADDSSDESDDSEEDGEDEM